MTTQGMHHGLPERSARIGLRLVLAVAVITTPILGQRPKDREREKDKPTEAVRQNGAGRNAASTPAQASPERGGTSGGGHAGGRAVGGAYTPTAPVAATPERHQPAQTPSGADRNANRRPANTGAADRNPAHQTRNPGEFDRNANTGTADRSVKRQPANTGNADQIGNRPAEVRSRMPNPAANRVHQTSRDGYTRDTQGRMETFRGRSGSEVHYRPDGRIADVRRGEMTVRHGAGNARRIVVQRSDRTMIVTNRSGHGFVQRPFAYRGNEYVNRTYYLRGHAYSRYYRPYSYRGLMLNSYVPTRYYSSGFYGWFNRPWGVGVRFSWGWMGAAWYGYYGSYFSPYPMYSAPSYWLTDYMLSARLSEAYAEGAASTQMYGVTPLSPAIKQAIRMEIEQQLAVERADADALARNEAPDLQAGFPRMLSDGNPHVFVIAYTLDVTDTGGRSCALTRGDVIRLATQPPATASAAVLEVVGAKPGSCPLGAVVRVGLEDLQDTYNQMRETLAQGVDELRSKSGMNGVPAMPANLAGAPRQSAFVEAAPAPDSQVAAELQQEVRAAEQLEKEVTAETGNAGADRVPIPVTITLGQTTDQVLGLVGNPKQIINIGNKQIFLYDRMKITFIAGKVTDVE